MHTKLENLTMHSGTSLAWALTEFIFLVQGLSYTKPLFRRIFGLCHARLSKHLLIDFNPHLHQPSISKCCTVVLISHHSIHYDFIAGFSASVDKLKLSNNCILKCIIK